MDTQATDTGVRKYAIHEAAEEGNAQELARLAVLGASVDDDYDPDADDDLDDGGVGINSRDFWGRTPLHLAILKAKPACVRAAIDSGADTGATLDGSPPLHMAVSVGQLSDNRAKAFECFGLLLDGGAEVSARDDEGRTAMHLCAWFGLAEFAAQLAKASEGGDEGLKAALAEARASGDTHRAEMLAAILAEDDSQPQLFSIRDKRGMLALHWAAYGRSTVVARWLLEQGESPTATDKEGRTPAHVAAAAGAVDCLGLLLEHEPSLERATDAHGRTPSQVASLFAHDGDGRSSGSGSAADDAGDSVTVKLFTDFACELHSGGPFPPKRGVDPIPAPENPGRVGVLVGDREGILLSSAAANPAGDLPECDIISRDAEITDILRVHDFNYVRRLLTAAQRSRETGQPSLLDTDTALNAKSWHVAVRAAGVALQAVDAVVDGKTRTAFCAIRPPGHHAGPTGVVTSENDPEGSHGFCLLNNVAIAAAYARLRRNVNRVAIVDFDVHHGNGTEAIVRCVAPQTVRTTMDLPTGQLVFSTAMYRPWRSSDDGDHIMFISSHGYGANDQVVVPKGQAGPPKHAGHWFYPGSGPTEGCGGLHRHARPAVEGGPVPPLVSFLNAVAAKKGAAPAAAGGAAPVADAQAAATAAATAATAAVMSPLKIDLSSASVRVLPAATVRSWVAGSAAEAGDVPAARASDMGTTTSHGSAVLGERPGSSASHRPGQPAGAAGLGATPMSSGASAGREPARRNSGSRSATEPRRMGASQQAAAQGVAEGAGSVGRSGHRSPRADDVVGDVFEGPVAVTGTPLAKASSNSVIAVVGSAADCGNSVVGSVVAQADRQADSQALPGSHSAAVAEGCADTNAAEARVRSDGGGAHENGDVEAAGAGAAGRGKVGFARGVLSKSGGGDGDGDGGDDDDDDDDDGDFEVAEAEEDDDDDDQDEEDDGVDTDAEMRGAASAAAGAGDDDDHDDQDGCGTETHNKALDGTGAGNVPMGHTEAGGRSDSLPEGDVFPPAHVGRGISGLGSNGAALAAAAGVKPMKLPLAPRNSRASAFDRKGPGRADPRTPMPSVLNLGMPRGLPPQEWRHAMATQVLPRLARFKPDLILVSAGFDAHYKDDLNFGYGTLRDEDYEWVTERLVKIANGCANGRIVSLLEGGYRIQGGVVSPFARATAAHVRALGAGITAKWDGDQEAADAETEYTLWLKQVQEEVAKAAAAATQAAGPPRSESQTAALVSKLEREEEAQAGAKRSRRRHGAEAGAAEVPAEAVATADASASAGEASGRRKRRRRAANKPVDYAALDQQMREEEAKKRQSVGQDGSK